MNYQHKYPKRGYIYNHQLLKKKSKIQWLSSQVFSVVPGLTGYWQAHGRSDTTYDERVQMDMYYLRNRSLVLDFKIILKTVVSVIKKEGAM